MTQLFKKGSEIKAFEVENNKVFTTIVLGEFNVTNPTLEQFKSLGWVEYTPPVPIPSLPTLEELVEQKIRERYSVNQEFEVLRKRDIEPEVFKEYFDYVEECITEAKQEPHREE